MSIGPDVQVCFLRFRAEKVKLYCSKYIVLHTIYGILKILANKIADVSLLITPWF